MRMYPAFEVAQLLCLGKGCRKVLVDTTTGNVGQGRNLDLRAHLHELVHQVPGLARRRERMGRCPAAGLLTVSLARRPSAEPSDLALQQGYVVLHERHGLGRLLLHLGEGCQQLVLALLQLAHELVHHRVVAVAHLQLRLVAPVLEHRSLVGQLVNLCQQGHATLHRVGDAQTCGTHRVSPLRLSMRAGRPPSIRS